MYVNVEEIDTDIVATAYGLPHGTIAQVVRMSNCRPLTDKYLEQEYESLYQQFGDDEDEYIDYYMDEATDFMELFNKCCGAEWLLCIVMKDELARTVDLVRGQPWLVGFAKGCYFVYDIL